MGKLELSTSGGGHHIPVGDHVLQIDNVQLPRKAFAITAQPDELLNLVLDALERQRWYVVAASS